MSERAKGQCLCGAVRFEAALPSLWCAHCHCTMCRRAHGAGLVTWVGVAEEGFRIVAGDDRLMTYASSPGATRSFCSVCGTTMLFRSTRWPGEVHITLANFTTPVDRTPQKHAFEQDRAAWIPHWDIGRGDDA